MFTHSPIFGWAKPVPVNFNNLRNFKKDTILVSVAGVAANLMIAVGCAIILVFLKIILINMGIIYFNNIFYKIFNFGIYINCLLAVFNMIPIPPLDGSKVLMSILPYEKAMVLARFEMYGMIILIMLLLLGMLNYIIGYPLLALMFLLGGRLDII